MPSLDTCHIYRVEGQSDKKMGADRTSLGTTHITWFIPPASVSHITFSITSSNFPSTSTPPPSIITTRQSFSLPCLRKISPCSPFPLNPQCQIFPHNFPLIQRTSWRPIDSIILFIPYHLQHHLFLPLHDHPPLYYDQASILY